MTASGLHQLGVTRQRVPTCRFLKIKREIMGLSFSNDQKTGCKSKLKLPAKFLISIYNSLLWFRYQGKTLGKFWWRTTSYQSQSTHLLKRVWPRNISINLLFDRPSCQTEEHKQHWPAWTEVAGSQRSSGINGGIIYLQRFVQRSVSARLSHQNNARLHFWQHVWKRRRQTWWARGQRENQAHTHTQSCEGDKSRCRLALWGEVFPHVNWQLMLWFSPCSNICGY